MAVAFDSAEVTSTTFVVLAFVFLFGPVNFLLTSYAFLKAKRWIKTPLIVLTLTSVYLALYNLGTVVVILIETLIKHLAISTKLFLMAFTGALFNPLTSIGCILFLCSIYCWRYVSHHKEDFNN